MNQPNAPCSPPSTNSTTSLGIKARSICPRARNTKKRHQKRKPDDAAQDSGATTPTKRSTLNSSSSHSLVQLPGTAESVCKHRILPATVASESGGSAPWIGFHDVIESPESVSRVKPPTITISAIRPATAKSHIASGRRAATCCGAGERSVMVATVMGKG